MSSDITEETFELESTRFGNLTVPTASIIEMPVGLIGFNRVQRFVMLEHKPPFSWLQSIEDPGLAFVIVDGGEFGDEYKANPPYGDKDIDLKEDDEYALLVIVTVRPDPRDTTANLKAPIFVNIRNRKGVQVIYDNPAFSTRFPLWADDGSEADSSESDSSEADLGTDGTTE
jgi:flagellar assembly factor FliW